ncbi:DUF6461 domain-containing protein [Kitasatospora sp. A2-31]|uniref:DUF6461 domain-containing protein n=1 Tax=Kitasatospora sp. A2-31 TaxID=2916414 RepID=UPI001EEAD12B|nr:DUF6461 domain-containing protein [Kitasatospora sp. A2-31]MCG6498733.1 DUF6461 domain-containing protein [Kitasatospora sp. A2-31]
MGDGIRWLPEGGETGYLSGVTMARGIDAQELALRMGAQPGTGTEPITHAEVLQLDMLIYRPGDRGDGIVRIGEHAGWAFAFEYGDSTGSERLEEISRDGVEVVHYTPVREHPPALVCYARDGHHICGFGLGEESTRWGEEPDLLLPALVAADILDPDGTTYRRPDDEHHTARNRRTLAVVEQHFGLDLPQALLTHALLPAYAVMGTPDMTTEDPDFDAACAWATANGHPLPTGRLRLLPDVTRQAYRWAMRH